MKPQIRIQGEADRLTSHWRDDPRWQGIERTYTAEQVVRLRGSVVPEQTLARLGAERLWELLRQDAPVRALGAMTGGQAVQMVKAGLEAIYLSGWQVAADGNLAGQHVSGPEPLPGQQRAGAREADQQRAAARRPDRLVRGPQRDVLARADRRRRRGRLRRPAQRVRADEGDDRGGRGRRALRGPARVGEEVRPPRRQGARADVAVRPHAQRGTARGRRARRADRARRAHGRALGRAADERRRRVRPRVRHGRAHRRGLLPRPRRDRRGDRALRSRTRRTPTCSGSRRRRPTSARRATFAQAIHEKFPGKLLAYNCSPSFNWRQHLDDEQIAGFQEQLAGWGYRFQFITLAGFHSLNAGMFELARGYSRDAMTAYVRLQQHEFELEEFGYTATRHQREVGAGYFDLVDAGGGAGQLDARAQGLDRGGAVRAPGGRRVTRSPAASR